MTTIRRRCRAGLVGLAASIAFGAFAQPAAPTGRGPASFEAFDQDDDGYVTEAEFDALRAERQAARGGRGAARAPAFSTFDSDSDGRLTPEELAEGRDALRSARSAGRGGSPMPGSQRPTFADFDLDGDGAITSEEFQEARGARIMERAEEGYPMRNLGDAPAFEAMDADGDDAITREELEAFQQRRQQERRGPSR
jgi:Ca2+-binding EF-hand superfamily protein